MNDGDNINIIIPKTIKDILTILRLNTVNSNNEFTVFVNSKKVTLPIGKTLFILNEKEVSIHTIVKENDDLKIKLGIVPSVTHLLDELNIIPYHQINISFNDKPVKLRQPLVTLLRNDDNLNVKSKLINKERLTLKRHEKTTFILQDIFRYIDLDVSQIKGDYHLFINNRPAEFRDPIQDNDAITMTWD